MTIDDYTQLAHRIRKGTDSRQAAQTLVDWFGQHISAAYLIMPQGLLTSSGYTPQPDVVRWLKTPANWRGITRPQRAEGALFVPLDYGGRVQGVLALQAPEDVDASVSLLVQVLAARLDELHTAQLTHRARQLLTRINQADTVKSVLQTTVEGLPSVFDCQAAVVYRFEPDDTGGEVLAEHPTRVAVGRSLGITDYEAFQATFDNDQTLIIQGETSRAATSQMRLAMRAGGYQQLMSAPMYAGGRLMGSLSVLLNLSPESREFSGREGELLHMLAQGVGSAYLNARHMTGIMDDLDNSLFRQIIDRTTVAVDIINPEGRVIYRNQSWNKMFRQPADSDAHFTGRLLPDEQYLAGDVILPGATRSHGWTNYVTLNRPDGSTFDAHLSVLALRDKRERVVGYSAIIDDVTEMHHIMDALQEQTARLTAASSVSRAIITNRGLDSMLQAVLSLICTRFGLHSAQLFAVEDDATVLTCQMACDKDGYTVQTLIGETRPLTADSVIQQVLSQKQTVMTADLSAQTDARPTPFAPDTGSEMILPLAADGEAPGVLAAQRIEPDAFDFDDMDVMQGIVDQLAIAMVNARLFEQLQERVRDITAMTEVSLLVQSSFDLDELLLRVYETVQRVYEEGRFGFVICNDDLTQAEITVFGEGDRQQYTHDLTQGDLISQMIEHTVPLFWANDGEKEDTAAYFDMNVHEVAESFIGLPLIAKNKTLGAIYAESDQSEMFDENDLQFMLTLANSTAFAIENMQLLQDTRRRVREMEILNSISRTLAQTFGSESMWEPLLLEMADLFPAGVPVVTRYDRAQDRLYSPAFESAVLVMPDPPEALCRAVIRHGTTLHFEDVQQADERFQALDIAPGATDAMLRAWLGTPLRTRNGEAIGVLALQSDRANSFSEREMSLLNTLAAQVSLALDNARLLTSEQERRQVANSLIDVGRVVTSTLNTDTVFERVLEQLGRVVRYDRAAVLMTDAADDDDTAPCERMQVHAAQGYDTALQGVQVEFDPDSPSAQVCRSQQPLTIPRTADSDIWHAQPQTLQPDTSQTWIGAPLLVQSRVIGLLMVERLDADSPYRHTDAQTVFALARQAAIAVQNAGLHSESERNLKALKQRARRLASMHHLALMINSTLEPEDILNRAAALLTDLFDVDHVGIIRMDADDEQGYMVAESPATGRTGEPVVRKDTPDYDTLTQLLRSNRPLQIKEESDSKSRTTLLAPMVAQNNALGSIGLDSYAPQRTFSPDERETFMTITAQIAMAIHNAELYEQAVESSRLKTEFLANISHELRTPLNAIIGYSELLLSGTYGDLQDKQRDRLQRVYRSGNDLLSLIDDILDLSKIEAGRMSLDRMALSPAMLIRDALKSVQHVLDDKGLALVTDIQEPLPAVDADLQRMRQVLVNLLTNAVKFTHEGQISVTAETLQLYQPQNEPRLPDSLDVSPGVWVLISVRDTGIGIAKKDRDIIFDAFRQVDGSTIREFEGTGLGLAITKRLVQMHSGHLWVESEEGRGSAFYVLLPADAELPQTASENGHTAQGAADNANDRPLVLMVNDDETTRQLVQTYLHQAGYQVESTLRPEQTIDLAADLQPAVLLLDVMLSRRENASLLRRLKANPQTATLPVVLVSILEPPADRRYSSDAVAYLTRPISQATLLEALEHVLSDK